MLRSRAAGPDRGRDAARRDRPRGDARAWPGQARQGGSRTDAEPGRAPICSRGSRRAATGPPPARRTSPTCSRRPAGPRCSTKRDRRHRLSRRRAAAVAHPGDDPVRRRRRSAARPRSPSPPPARSRKRSSGTASAARSASISRPSPAARERQAVAAAIDAALPQPFERTAVNGFGFLQIVRRRARASLPELLLRRSGRRRGARRAARRRTPSAARPASPYPSPAEAHRWLAARPELLEALARRSGQRHDFAPAQIEKRMAKPDTCPICGKPTAAPHKPFCSQGCRDRDLLNGSATAIACPASRLVPSADGRAGQRAASPSYRPLSFRPCRNAQVAQLVEHVTENHGVGGSIPSLGTTPSQRVKRPLASGAVG